ncbi:MAG: fatty acyl-AMP ligase, partial [Acidobacteria bacterium]|nr:fatty acyl-AMP ligase [Acidobacteriota bacterium]MDW7984935.1 fatty acyl-AMP ligase [Acidobacteriota bacterium]
HRWGLQDGEPAVIVLPTDVTFFLALWGILLGRGIPVPVYPPVRLHRMQDYGVYVRHVLENCQARLIVTDRTLAAFLRFLRAEPAGYTFVTVEDLPSGPALSQPLEVGPDDTALLQYTSGSTAAPRGVQLHHRHLVANILAMGHHVGLLDSDAAVSWLPLYHDMGLIGMVLGTLFWGLPLYVFSPLEFVRRPVYWLRSIARYRATISAAPNFAYGVCATKLRDFELEDLDLTSWRAALCGAEPILAATIEEFMRRFRPYGFRPEAFMAAYGLAENTLAVTMAPVGEGLRVDRVDRRVFEVQRRAVPTNAPDTSVIPWVACGVPIPDTEVRIVDAGGRSLPERHEGTILVRSPSVMAGYYRNPQATAQVLRDGWLDTGDLGYMADGYLYVTGRQKELIIRGGRNYYPQDIEQVVQTVEGIRRGNVCAFGIPDEREGTERIVIIAETRVQDPARWARIEADVRERVLREVGVPVSEIRLVPPGTLPKTTSGKLQRVQCRQAYLAGKVRPVQPRSVRRPTPLRWLQAGWRRLRRLFRRSP